MIINLEVSMNSIDSMGQRGLKFENLDEYVETLATNIKDGKNLKWDSDSWQITTIEPSLTNRIYDIYQSFVRLFGFDSQEKKEQKNIAKEFNDIFIDSINIIKS